MDPQHWWRGNGCGVGSSRGSRGEGTGNTGEDSAKYCRNYSLLDQIRTTERLNVGGGCTAYNIIKLHAIEL
jgi:hypothetical protein